MAARRRFQGISSLLIFLVLVETVNFAEQTFEWSWALYLARGARRSTVSDLLIELVTSIA